MDEEVGRIRKNERLAINRKDFEEEYLGWIHSVARDIGYKLSLMEPNLRAVAIESYRELEDPHTVFRSAPESILTLAGDTGSAYIFVETDAVSIFPSLYSSSPQILDYALAMNRRYYFRGLWFSIISLNSVYIRESTDRMLAFALEHEFEMNRLYFERTADQKALAPDEKRLIFETAKKSAAEKLGVAPDELVREEMLMLRLSDSQILIPKPYAEMALLCYLEDNFGVLKGKGVKSKSAEEEVFGAGLYGEFMGWADFSHRTYRIFVREIVDSLQETYRGYA